MRANRSYTGPALDGTYQHITERPSLDDEADDVVYATNPEPEGEETTENVPSPETPDSVSATGQSTFDDWGWSA